MDDSKKEIVAKNKSKKNLFIIISILIVIIGGIYFFNVRNWVSTDDAYVETLPVNIAPKVQGEVIVMNVEDNQKVKEGDLLAQIDAVDYEVKLASISARYEAAILNQKKAKASFSAVNSEIELAKRNLERYSELYKSGAVSKLEYDNVKTNYDNVSAKLTHVQQDLFSDKNDESVADADLKFLEAEKKQAELALSYTKIYAPLSGTVTRKNIEKGALVKAGQPLFSIVPEEVWIVANFKENQLTNMKIGQEVKIKVDTYPNKVFKGKIDSIQQLSGAKASLFPPENAVGSFVKIVQRIPVKIVFTEDIDKNKYNIVAGMSVVPKVYVGK